MSSAAAFREKASGVLIWLGVLAVALLWMWFNALLVREMGAESLARAGWAGEPGTVYVSRCTSEVIDQETMTEWTDCAGTFTPADGSLSSRSVAMPNAGGELTPGSTVEVRLVDGMAFRQSWFQAGGYGAGVLLFGLLGGVPIAAVVMTAYGLSPIARRWSMPSGVQAYVFGVIALAGELLLTLLLDRSELL
ncbi:hypothetical protein ACFQZ4_37425 [Catellatospora coxensis]|uniref:Uncharacterized protein n=1 Tax=Catellatospora coxensis TaxID=310354 RepID=A0A8J3KIK1_9ACTN|nr:hypothetical protein [Catellatospora coxensis]GIG03732.1 hypothetical protein Cco03nite_04320 [Catellatospora coxensis]